MMNLQSYMVDIHRVAECSVGSAKNGRGQTAIDRRSLYYFSKEHELLVALKSIV